MIGKPSASIALPLALDELSLPSSESARERFPFDEDIGAKDAIAV